MQNLLATFLLGFIFILGEVNAVEFEDAVFPELITSGRALAMGNAYAAKADDHHSVFYNPAGLGTFRKWHFHLTNFHIETNKDLATMGGGGSITDASSNIMKAYEFDGVRQLLLENRGSHSHARLHAFPNITTRYFSMGYMFSRQMRAALGPQANDRFEYAERTDHGPVLALNFSLWGGIFKLGASAVYLSRTEAIGDADANTTFELQDDEKKTGRAVIITSGAKLTFPWKALPTFSVTVHNSSNQRFSSGGKGGLPDRIKTNVVGGFSITPQIGKYTRAHLEVNLKDMGNAHKDVSSVRKMALGLEFDYKRGIFVRFGYGDGFGSAGIGIKHRTLEVDISTYAVDTSSSSFQGDEDRRFVFSVSSGF